MGSYEFYKECMEEGTPAKVVFSHLDKENRQYVAYDNGLRIVLPLAEYFGSGEAELEKILKTPRITQALGREMEVLIKNVNQVTGVVTCNREGIRVILKARDKEEIDKVLDKHNNETVTVTGRIIAIIGPGSQSRAILLTENGLKLIMFCKKWNYDYVEDLRDVAKVGDVLKVAIYARNNTKTEGDYLASRAETLPNPWEGIDERFHKGDIVVCRIVKKWNNAYGGRINGVDGILAFVAFPKNKDLRMIIDQSYVCSVGGVNAETRSFRLYPFALAK